MHSKFHSACVDRTGLRLLIMSRCAQALCYDLLVLLLLLLLLLLLVLLLVVIIIIMIECIISYRFGQNMISYLNLFGWNAKSSLVPEEECLECLSW